MADFRLELNNKALGDLVLGRGSDGEAVRGLIEQETMRRVGSLSADVGAENVDYYVGGKSRARGTIRRLEALQNEAKDGKLSRLLSEG